MPGPAGNSVAQVFIDALRNLLDVYVELVGRLEAAVFGGRLPLQRLVYACFPAGRSMALLRRVMDMAAAGGVGIDGVRAPLKGGALLAALNRLLALAFMKDAKSARPGRMAEVWSALPTPFHPAGVILPDDLRWSAPNGDIADALRFMHAEQERVRTALIPTCVSHAFVGWLNAWGGAVPDARDDWAAALETEAVVAAGPDAVFLARFVAVAGVAAEQMPAGGLTEFRARWAGDDPELALKSVCSWASWMTARRVVAWMAAPLATEPTAAVGVHRAGSELPAPVSLSAARGMGGHAVDAGELL